MATEISIILTPAPLHSGPDVLASIALRVDARGIVTEQIVLHDPLARGEGSLLRWYLEEYWRWPYEGFAQRGAEVESLLVEIGQRLFRAVFSNLDHTNLRQINVESTVPTVLSLPWELLHDGNDFLALRRPQPVSIVRRLATDEATANTTTFELPLRILLVTSRPDNAGFVDQRVIAGELLDELQEAIRGGVVDLEFLRPPTIAALQDRLLRQPPIHVLHFDGHGAFVQADEGQTEGNNGRGKLIFEMDNGEPDFVDVEQQLVPILPQSTVRLAVLTACQSATSAGDNAFSSVAAQLIQRGVDAVVAMSASVLVVSAARYAEAFYRSLAGGTSAPIAHQQACRVLHDYPFRHIHRRRRNEVGQPVMLQDWWLPHFYLQRPLVLSPVASTDNNAEQLCAPKPRHISGDMPPESRYGFSGRAVELIRIERQLRRRKVVILHGFGGVGKTALARETADWLTRVQMYRDACFISLDHGGDVLLVLKTIGRHFGLETFYRREHTEAALQEIRTRLCQQPTLLVADNIESILPGGDAALPAVELKQLWDVLLNLGAIPGSGLLITTRNIALSDLRLLEPSQRTAYIELRGLSPDDAYALTSRMLDHLGIDRARVPYSDLRELLADLDHHPLAIQLVLPALQDYSIERIHDDFGALLPQFVDDNEQGRNRSLLASLDYSLKRLSDAQRVVLSRLAVFEGGASTITLFDTAGISEDEWAMLRLALEQTALITVERVFDEVLFFRFHPVLTPFLRSLPNVDLASRSSIFADVYRKMGDALSQLYQTDPERTRPLIWCELPNFRRALDLMLEGKFFDDAASLMNTIAEFLVSFGLSYERDALLERVGTAVDAAVRLHAKALTWAEYNRESTIGDNEFDQGAAQGAFNRLNRLLERIEVAPEAPRLGRGSYEHCMTLRRLGCCLVVLGRLTTAEERLTEALNMIDALLAQQLDMGQLMPVRFINQQIEQHEFVHLRAVLLSDLGKAFIARQEYQRARASYEEAQALFEKLGDIGNRVVLLLQLSELELALQHQSAEAAWYLNAAGELIAKLREPNLEAVYWRQLGFVAQRQRNWVKAEHYYRQSLTLYEQLNDLLGVADVCNLLSDIAREAGRSGEAKAWLERRSRRDKRNTDIE